MGKNITTCLVLLGLGCGMIGSEVSAKNSLAKQRKIMPSNREPRPLNLKAGPKKQRKIVSINQRSNNANFNSKVKLNNGKKVNNEIINAMNAVEHLYVEHPEDSSINHNDVKAFSDFLCTVYAKKFDKPLADTFNVKKLERTFNDFFTTGHTEELDNLLERIGYTKAELTKGNRTMYVYYNTADPKKNEVSVHGASIFLRTEPDNLTFFYGVKDWMKEKIGSDGKYDDRHIRNSFDLNGRIDSREMQKKSLKFQNDCFDYVRTNRLRKNLET